ncbi:unnamed protein product [Heterosigma akashiwo]
MSMCPMVVDGNAVIRPPWVPCRRGGVPLGQGLQLEDSLWAGLTDSYAGTPMGVTAENLAEKYGITREECDEYGFRSQMAWGEANKAGVFEAELAPVEVKGRKGPQLVTADESPRPDVQLEKMRSLKPVFKKDGCVTAGNASGISDGAGSVLLASEAAVAKYNLTPLARLAGWGRAGCAPEIMGIGPVPAIAGALAAAGTSLGEVGLVEINEAFAAQYLACEGAWPRPRQRGGHRAGPPAGGLGRPHHGPPGPRSRHRPRGPRRDQGPRQRLHRRGPGYCRAA